MPVVAAQVIQRAVHGIGVVLYLRKRDRAADLLRRVLRQAAQVGRVGPAVRLYKRRMLLIQRVVRSDPARTVLRPKLPTARRVRTAFLPSDGAARADRLVRDGVLRSGRSFVTKLRNAYEHNFAVWDKVEAREIQRLLRARQVRCACPAARLGAERRQTRPAGLERRLHARVACHAPLC